MQGTIPRSFGCSHETPSIYIYLNSLIKRIWVGLLTLNGDIEIYRDVELVLQAFQ